MTSAARYHRPSHGRIFVPQVLITTSWTFVYENSSLRVGEGHEYLQNVLAPQADFTIATRGTEAA